MSRAMFVPMSVFHVRVFVNGQQYEYGHKTWKMEMDMHQEKTA
jgi:hypothetical protein